MAKGKGWEYIGHLVEGRRMRSDARVIGKTTWDASNDWTVAESDLPAQTLTELKEGDSKSEFKQVDMEEAA